MRRRLFSERFPAGFDSATSLPTDAESRHRWQEANKLWWEEHPMRYDWQGQENVLVGTREFFEELDQRFLSTAAEYLPPKVRAFDRLIPYDKLPSMDVLEIGVGSGTHAGLLAENARSFTGIDLTESAVELTRQRFDLFDLPGRIERMDAERLDFEAESFDFVWSWGVVHHSADTSAIIAEIRRVLRPGGRAVIMIYHRSIWGYYISAGLIRGILLGDLLRTRSLHKTVQRTTDGALARYYTVREWRALAERQGLRVTSSEIYGAKVELLPLPAGRFKTALLSKVPAGLGRLILHHFRQGSFLVVEHQAC